MKKMILAVAAVLALAPAGVAWADGPSGSTEEDNQVTCGSGEQVETVTIYAGANGVEVCDDSSANIQGRIIVTSDDGGYIAADGDADNEGQLQGWARLDQGGPSCGNTDPADEIEDDTDATDGGGSSANCG